MYQRRFFEDYKKNENKEVVVADEIKGHKEAMRVIKESLVRTACYVTNVCKLSMFSCVVVRS